jgi:hypothetical protein
MWNNSLGDLTSKPCCIVATICEYVDDFVHFIFYKVVYYILVGTRDVQTQFDRAQPARACAQSVPNPARAHARAQCVRNLCPICAQSVPNLCLIPARVQDWLIDRLSELIYRIHVICSSIHTCSNLLWVWMMALKFHLASESSQMCWVLGL